MLKFTEWCNWSNWEGILGYSLGTLPLAIRNGLAALAKYGSNAHLFIPGVGKINGIEVGNYIESTGVTSAVLLDPIGRICGDYCNGTPLTQATTANKPILNRDANGNYYWKKGASASWLSGTPLFDGTVRDYYVGAAFAPGALDSGIKYIFSPAMGSGVAMRPVLYANAWDFRIFDSDGTNHLDARVGVLTAGTSYVMSGRRIGNTVYPKLNGIAKTAVTKTGQAAITPTQSRIMSDASGITHPFQGSAYGFCAVQATVSEQDGIDIDNMLAFFSGVTMQ